MKGLGGGAGESIGWQGYPHASLKNATAAKRRSGRSANSLRSDSADRFSSAASKQQ